MSETKQNNNQDSQDMSLLIVDDDKPFLQRLARAMETRGYAVDTADTVAEGIRKVESAPPAYAVVDMRLEDGNGLEVIDLIRRRR
ncbi:MAG: response regulator, partial [Rhizobiales bacterium]|nr:response regulator [Hyphomicrobiales bacterium]